MVFKSNCIKDLNVRAKATKLLEENIHFCDLGFGKEFLDTIIKA